MTCYLWLGGVVGLYLLLQLGNAGAVTIVDQQTTAKQQQLLYTFEYDNHPHEWELVPYDDASFGAVRWMMGLKDRLTVSRELPLGQDLMVCVPANGPSCTAAFE